MSRIRTIKPEFFTSEDIVSLSPLARLLYVAIWCEADKEGRLQWKPRTLKMRYLPGDDCDIEAICSEIVSLGLVVLYGDGLAFVPSFKTHQHINPRERDSTIRAPNEDETTTRQARVSDASVTRRGEGKGKEGKGREGELDASASPSPPAPKADKSKGTRLPDDWQPSSEDLLFGQQKGLHPPEIARAGERFKLWALSASGPNAIKRNWSMAFRNWLLSDAEKLGRSAPAPSVAPVEAVPQFQTDEEHQIWWNDRHRRLSAAAGAK